MKIFTEVQKLTQACLEAAEPVRVKRGNPYSVGEVVIPGARDIVPLLIRYATSRRLEVEINGMDVGDASVPAIQPGESGLDVTVEADLMGRRFSETLPVPYVSEEIRDLCHGDWVSFDGPHELRLGWDFSLVQVGRGGCAINFEDFDVRLKRRPFRLVALSIASIVITPTHGEIVGSSWFGTWLFPRLIWGE